jgi:hypothetical protein
MSSALSSRCARGSTRFSRQGERKALAIWIGVTFVTIKSERVLFAIGSVELSARELQRSDGDNAFSNAPSGYWHQRSRRPDTVA